MNTAVGRIATAWTLTTLVVLTGCSGPDSTESRPSASAGEHDGHAGMDHPADGGPVPAGMVPATHPTYPVGSEVILTADHMKGMDGARAQVVGAYDTNTYAVDVTPTTGGEPITDHKWVVQEEIRDAGTQRLPDGTHVVLTADHMPGMNGARATIVSSTDETVYAVDYEADGMTMTNHKWVVESEMRPAS